MTFSVALTGGIASGKSTVAGLFAELDVPVIDSDVIAREVVEPGSEGLAAVVERFGRTILRPDGALDRAALRRMIFENPDSKQSLESILHPRIRSLMGVRSAQAGGPYQIWEIPLLVESGGAYAADRVLVVDCDPEVQIARLIARDGGNRDSAERILAAQASREERLAIADDIIVNNGERDELPARVLTLHTSYLGMAERPR